MTTTTRDPRQLAFRCVHHWIIPSPDGRSVLPGKCAHCGATKEFRVWNEGDKPSRHFAIAPRDVGYLDRQR